MINHTNNKNCNICKIISNGENKASRRPVKFANYKYCEEFAKYWIIKTCNVVPLCNKAFFNFAQGEPKFKYLTFINVMKMPLNKHGENKTGKPQCKHTHTPTNTHTQKTAQDISPASLSVTLLLFYFSRYFISAWQKIKTCADRKRPREIRTRKAEKTLYGKQLLANRIE